MSQHLTKCYPYLTDKPFLGSVYVEFKVHYFFTWFFARVTPKRQMAEDGAITPCGLQYRSDDQRMWISTVGATYAKLEDL
jgi:hypothetical protein